MLFFFRKLIEALFLPLGISALITITGVLLRRRWLAFAGVAVLYLLSTPMVGELLLRPLERVYEPRAVEACPEADAIVVLSGGIVRGKNAAGVQWGDSANRYFAGFDLAMAGKAPILILSAGDPVPGSRGPGEVLRQVAIRSGLQPERVVVTHNVQTTEDEALAISEMPNIHSILLVTSAFHMSRAVFLFQSAGLRVEAFPTDQRFPGKHSPRLLDFIPSAGGVRDSEEAIREYYGLAVYHGLFLVRSL
jgi:uncharacterized SAM-binding protein YcdF (DUF218 family)